MNINRRIELRHLRYFICVADEMHFSRAVERLGLAQAPLSQQIKQLEERIGVQLFERTTRSVRLTQAGTVFFEHARNALASIEDGVEAARLIMGETNRKLTIGCFLPAIHTCLPQIIQLFRQCCPDIHIDIRMQTWPLLRRQRRNKRPMVRSRAAIRATSAAMTLTTWAR